MISADKRVLVRGKLRRNARACARDINLEEKLLFIPRKIKKPIGGGSFPREKNNGRENSFGQSRDTRAAFICGINAPLYGLGY